MRLLRHYFISEDLDNLEKFEIKLEESGIANAQIHVLTSDENEGAVVNRIHLHKVRSFMKKDVIHSTLSGATIGFVAFILVMIIANMAGWTNSTVGQMPFIFLAVFLLGFCTWLGGLRGIQEPNRHFKQFEKALSEGKHVFFTDISPSQETILQEILGSHPQIKPAGTGSSPPVWIVAFQTKVPWFFREVWP